MPKPANPIPPGFHSLTAHLSVNGAAAYSDFLQRTVEQAFRLPCRYSYRHSPKNVGTDADVAT